MHGFAIGGKIEQELPVLTTAENGFAFGRYRDRLQSGGSIFVFDVFAGVSRTDDAKGAKHAAGDEVLVLGVPSERLGPGEVDEADALAGFDVPQADRVVAAAGD